ncbi:hypothetical protein CTA1_5097 [Colletotrichum tanaceti]|uniref:Uncharacterized protein n=1 Tax=Colletotrichum tanaceti TaxID=1306861 RepID=A0A4U6X639_9PEZI|nr:hypothetical protein CTA1_5097 [Colletotrichum tanaceti]
MSTKVSSARLPEPQRPGDGSSTALSASFIISVLLKDDIFAATRFRALFVTPNRLGEILVA